jgi:hypothetical protein
MARVLRDGRDHVSAAESGLAVMTCAQCGTPMNQHAQKVDFASPNLADPVFFGTVQQIHGRTGCGAVQTRAAM